MLRKLAYFAVAAENEAVNPNLLVSRHADPLDKARLIGHGTECSHEPAISISALSHVIRSWSVNIESRRIEDISYALDALRPEHGLRLVGDR